MIRREFRVIIRHDESLFPDEGALRSTLIRAITSRVEWIPDIPSITEIEVRDEEES